MSSGSVRRRPTGRLASLQEPLLGGSDEDSPRTPKLTLTEQSEKGSFGDGEAKLREHRAWQDNLVNLVAQWVAWFGHVIKGAGTVLAGIGGSMAGLMLLRPRNLELPPMVLSPEQEENLRKLKERLNVPFDGSREEHQEALRALWRAAYPDKKLIGMVSPQWKDMGWQGNDPATDFRGGGFISLENLLHFAYVYPHSFRRLLNKEEGKRADWEYPFAVAGLNITFMLIQLFDLRAEVPNSMAGRRFLRLIGEDAKAFDNVYCVAFEMMDAQWLAMGASYMEFNAVLGGVRAQLEHALAQGSVRSVQDLQAYALLTRN